MIDGVAREWELDRIHFVKRTLRTTGVVDPPQDLPLASATLGIIFSYPVDGLPQEATMDWDVFTPRIQKVPSSATDEVGGMPSILTPEDPQLVWKNFLKNPRNMALVELPPPPAGEGAVHALAAERPFGAWVLLQGGYKAAGFAAAMASPWAADPAVLLRGVTADVLVEAAVVGRPDDVTGQAICAFVTPGAGVAVDDQLKTELATHVASEIGKLARPAEIRFTDALPKTRSGKIMRRLLRDVAAGIETAGDTSTIEDLSVLAQLRAGDD